MGHGTEKTGMDGKDVKDWTGMGKGRRGAFDGSLKVPG